MSQLVDEQRVRVPIRPLWQILTVCTTGAELSPPPLYQGFDRRRHWWSACHTICYHQPGWHSIRSGRYCAALPKLAI